MPTDQKGEKGDKASITEVLRSFTTTMQLCWTKS